MKTLLLLAALVILQQLNQGDGQPRPCVGQSCTPCAGQSCTPASSDPATVTTAPASPRGPQTPASVVQPAPPAAAKGETPAANDDSGMRPVGGASASLANDDSGMRPMGGASATLANDDSGIRPVGGTSATLANDDSGVRPVGATSATLAKASDAQGEKTGRRGTNPEPSAAAREDARLGESAAESNASSGGGIDPGHPTEGTSAAQRESLSDGQAASFELGAGLTMDTAASVFTLWPEMMTPPVLQTWTMPDDDDDGRREAVVSLLQERCRRQSFSCDSSEWVSLSFQAWPFCMELNCSDCSCAKDCYTDNPPCCIERLVQDAMQSLQLHTPQCYSNALKSPPKGKPMFYTMIDECGPDWPRDELDARCRNVRQEELESMRPVVSDFSNMVYRNQFCALCNGEEASDLTEWDIRAFCTQQTLVKNTTDFRLDQVVQQIMDTPFCFLEFEPPEGTRADKCEPVSLPWTNVCSTMTGVLSDTLLEDTCQVVHTYGAINVSSVHLACSLCSVINPYCDSRGKPLDTPFPFVLVISAAALSDVTQASADDNRCRCAEGEVYDEYKSECRQLTCSQLRSLEKGRCVPFVKKVLGVGYQLLFHLLPTRVVNKPFFVSPELYLRGMAVNIYTAFKNKTQRSPQTFQTQMFRVVLRTEKAAEKEAEVQRMPEFTVNNFTVAVKLAVAKNTDIDGVEEFLMTFARSVWSVPTTFEADGFIELDARPAFVPQSELRDGLEFYDQFSADASNVTTVEKGRFSEHTIDVSELAFSLDTFGFRQPVTPSGYSLVQHTLTCPKVSFLLTDAGAAKEHFSTQADSADNVSPTNSDGRPTPTVPSSTHSPTVSSSTILAARSIFSRRRPNSESPTASTTVASATALSLQSGDNQNSRGGHSRLLHSIDPDTGELVLTYDEETGSVLHVPSGRRVPFQYVEMVEGGVVHVCADQLYEEGRSKTGSLALLLERLFSPELVYLSVGCQSLSVVCLFLVLLTYGLFPELRTLPGKNTMGLVASLLLAMLLFEVGVARVELPLVCTLVGVAIHFCLLSAFTWMVICSAHMYRVFTSILTSRTVQTEINSTQFRKHVAVSLAIPALIVALTLTANWAGGRGGCVVDVGYGRGVCYVSNAWSLWLASVLPICLAVTANLGLFVATLRSLRSLNTDLVLATRSQRHQLAVYVRMSTLTGVNWVAGLLTAVIDSVVLWYVFIVLCGLQGVYVFVAFVCTRRVAALYRNLLCCVVKDVETSRRDLSETASTFFRIRDSRSSISGPKVD